MPQLLQLLDGSVQGWGWGWGEGREGGRGVEGLGDWGTGRWVGQLLLPS